MGRSNLVNRDQRFRNGAVEYDERSEAQPIACATTCLGLICAPDASSYSRASSLSALRSSQVNNISVLRRDHPLEREANEARAAKREAEDEARRLKTLNDQVAQREKKLVNACNAQSVSTNQAILGARALRDQGELKRRSVAGDERLRAW